MARQKPAERRSVQLNDLARAAVDMLAYTFRSHGIELQLELARRAARGAAPTPTRSARWCSTCSSTRSRRWPRRRDRTASAACACPPASRRGATTASRVSGCAWPTAGRACAPALREKIFEPFFTTKPEGIGTGLGLAVSRSLVREHGGQLGLEIASSGAVFRLSLPISGARGRMSPSPAALAGAEDAGAGACAGGRRRGRDRRPDARHARRRRLRGGHRRVRRGGAGAAGDGALRRHRLRPAHARHGRRRRCGARCATRHPALARRMLFVTGDTLSPGAEQFLADAALREPGQALRARRPGGPGAPRC